MKTTKWPQIIFTLAIVLGVGTTWLVYHWLEQQTSARAPKAELSTQEVVVAAVDLAPGTQIRPESLKMTKWPVESLPPGAFTVAETAKDRVVLQPIMAGEPVMESKLAAVGTNGGLTAIISPGKRAMSVRVDEIIGVAGFVVPGTRVDVLATIDEEHQNGAAAQAILQNIKVLTSGQKIINEKNEPASVNVVTLEVTPQEAERLALASNRGRIQLALRNQIDTDQPQTYAVRTPELLTLQAHAAKPSAPAPKQFVVEVIRGNKRSSQEF